MKKGEKMLFAVVVTAFITALITVFAINNLRAHEEFASLRAKCPQLILDAHDPERAFIQFLDGTFFSIRPRPKPSAASPNN